MVLKLYFTKLNLTVDGKTAWSCPECGCNDRPGTVKIENATEIIATNPSHPDGKISEDYNRGYSDGYKKGLKNSFDGEYTVFGISDDKSVNYNRGFQNGHLKGFEEGQKTLQFTNYYQKGFNEGKQKYWSLQIYLSRSSQI